MAADDVAVQLVVWLCLQQQPREVLVTVVSETHDALANLTLWMG